MEKDIIGFLFEQKDTEELFTENKELLSRLALNIAKIENDINSYIERRVHPNSKPKLYELIDSLKEQSINFSHKEREQIYKTGFSDAINVILSAVSIK